MKLRDGELEPITDTVRGILKNVPAVRENLIPLLQQVQEKLGYLPPPAMEQVAEALDIPAVEVYGLATFYNQFRLTPPGDNQIKVCMGTACYMVGGRIAMESFERRLGIKEGETSPDRQFSLERVACVGCCTMAPVVVVNDTVEGHVTPTRVDGIMLSFANGVPKAPVSPPPGNEEGAEKQTGKGSGLSPGKNAGGEAGTENPAAEKPGERGGSA